LSTDEKAFGCDFVHLRRAFSILGFFSSFARTLGRGAGPRPSIGAGSVQIGSRDYYTRTILIFTHCRNHLFTLFLVYRRRNTL
jgi:hypothetical protein